MSQGGSLALLAASGKDYNSNNHAAVVLALLADERVDVNFHDNEVCESRFMYSDNIPSVVAARVDCADSRKLGRNGCSCADSACSRWFIFECAE